MNLPVPDGEVVFFRGCPVAAVKEALERYFGRVVVDETTSKGRYDFELHLRRSTPSVDHALEPVAAQLKKAGVDLNLAVRRVDGALVIDGGKAVQGALRYRVAGGNCH
jgi:uncharacterized protein (TIGR03435 family)